MSSICRPFQLIPLLLTPGGLDCGDGEFIFVYFYWDDDFGFVAPNFTAYVRRLEADGTVTDLFVLDRWYIGKKSLTFADPDSDMFDWLVFNA